jgi:hypothetical protein
MPLPISLALFEIGDGSSTKDFWLLLNSVPNLLAALVATIFYMIANTALPEIVSLGRQIFPKQYKNWKHLDIIAVCQFELELLIHWRSASINEVVFLHWPSIALAIFQGNCANFSGDFWTVRG